MPLADGALLPNTAPYASGSETSREAAESLAPVRLHRDHLRVLKHLLEAEELCRRDGESPLRAGTDDFGIQCEVVRCAQDAYRDRRGALAKAGFIEKLPKAGRTRRKKRADVWRVTAAGRRYFEENKRKLEERND